MGPVGLPFGPGVAEYSPQKFFQPGLLQPLTGLMPSGDSEFDCIAYLNTIKFFASAEDDAASVTILSLQQPDIDDFQYTLVGWQLQEADAQGFVPTPPQVQPSAEDDFMFAIPGWLTYEDDACGFPPTPPPPTQPGAEDDFTLPFPAWTAGHDADASGFPLPISTYQCEDEAVKYAPPYPTYIDDTSGFAPAAQFLPPSGDEDPQQLLGFPGSLAAFVPMDEDGFVAAPSPGPSILGRSQRLLEMPLLPLPLR